MINDLWFWWKRTVRSIGNFQSIIFFDLLYLMLILPIGYLSRMFKDFLGLKGFPKWHDFEDNTSNLNKLKEQY